MKERIDVDDRIHLYDLFREKRLEKRSKRPRKPEPHFRAALVAKQKKARP